MLRVKLKRGYSIEVRPDQPNGGGITVLGNYSKSGYLATQIISKYGICPTVRENHGQVTGIMVEKEHIMNQPINTMPDGLCRPIKAQYYKTSKANYKYKSTYGATGVMNDLRIRKLTPKECWRLMDFDDEDIDKCIAAGISNTQLYKQAGNSIVVAVLEKVLGNLLIERKEE